MTGRAPHYGGPYEPQDPHARQPYGRDAYGRDAYGHDAYGHDAYGPDARGQQPYAQQPYEPYEQPYGHEAYDPQRPVAYVQPQEPYDAYDAQPYEPQPGPHAYPYPHSQGTVYVPPQAQQPQQPQQTQQTQQPQQPQQAQPVPQAPPPPQARPHRTHPGPGPLPPEQHTTSATGALVPDDPAPRAPRTASASAPRSSTRRARPSPIIAPGLQPAAVTAVLALLLAGTAPLPRAVLAVAVVLLQAVTAAGWFRLNGMWPARQGIALAFLAGVTADVALLAAGREHTGTALVGTLGIWCVLAIVLQLRNHSSPDERLYALTAAFTATGLTVVAAGHLAIAPTSTDAVTVGAAAVGVAVLARALPLPPFVSPAVALLAAAGAGIAAGRLTDMGNEGALLGLAAGVCALTGLRVASYDFPSRFVHMTAGVALPLTLAAPAVYLLGRALV
ncbi:hypothetical protein DVA86_19425 [Streptomyces armeniacus]|uniref:Peptidase C83 domain-containing protein n=1 Tax=Streptomyces armeniacus TaxID=83291 RepID=A0A345XS76_9ACTN|nr:hypothetical protein [Streptomyces armeniacus]AXK34492.1 hypothetical protein DVA86_19425 [Streptomyces armeniacus]